MNVVEMKTEAKARALTPEEKRKVRIELDGVFDEGAGMYLDGKSDQSIGQKLGIPWACIKDYREFAYGPLKSNEDTAALRSDIEALATLLAGLKSQVHSAESARDKITVKLAAVEKKLGFG